ncbi:MAG: aldo/keto reductase [Anaerolineae bacterium]|jgi:aryl-alcohol dehydrogenase-like predicted oxidoreductase|nr:aldo/keto reductase [Anaerolineae bacterium]MBT4308997.1 aldo/keto reductase [Anaerolineae bacterium]MBT4459076.1 aldo/keto reductase [Anaerolineae bacterium]MBT4843555.1 aldo/keto reductase [Anaerolineae bacterium]MBT6060747.1 aldo/keto reductase [Anaerolineae bacterium]
MKYRRLGNSGLLVSNLALGTMIFGEKKERSTSAEDATRIIHRYLDVGGNHIDTANVYAGGRSEEIVGAALRNHRDKVVLATKVRFPMGEGVNAGGLSRHHIFQSVDASLKRLQTDVIDLLYMHCWDPLTPIEESLRAFDDLVTAGKVRYIGVSNFKAWQLMKALGISEQYNWARFVAAQYQYSLVTRDIEEEYLDLCESEGVGLTPWGPLGGGFLSGKYQQNQKPTQSTQGRLATSPSHEEEAWVRRNIDHNWQVIAAMNEVATKYNATHSQIALAWLLSRQAVASIILGVRTIEQLDDNLGASEIKLSVEDIALLDKASATPEGYPYRFIKNYGQRSVNS